MTAGTIDPSPSASDTAMFEPPVPDPAVPPDDLIHTSGLPWRCIKPRRSPPASFLVSRNRHVLDGRNELLLAVVD